MRWVTIVLLALSVIQCLCRIVPISSNTSWPAAMIAAELAPWFIVINLAGGLLAYRWTAVLSFVFAAALVFNAWPLIQIPGIEREMARQWQGQKFSKSTLHPPGMASAFLNTFRPFRVPNIKPRSLPMGMLLFKGGGKGLPIIVDIHGGSWQSGDPHEDRPFCSYFAAKGYAVFSIDYRRAPKDPFPAQIDDVRAAIEWIHDHATEYGGDPAKIAVEGRSAGGHLALLAAYTPSKVPIRAVVSFYGPSDLAEGYRDPPVPDPVSIRSKLAAFLGGAPDQVQDAYRDASPKTYANGALPPTLQVQGQRDHIVKPRFARELHRQLLANGTRALLLELPWADHGFDFLYFGPGNALANAYIEGFLAETMN